MWQRAAWPRLDRASVALGGIVAVAAVLRFAGIHAGIPYAVGVDEPQLVNRAVIMMKTGDFNPHFFDYPSLYIYAQLLVAIARFLAGALGGRWNALDQFTYADAYLWGRVLTATMGTLTVVLVYRCARPFGRGPALLAAALMAVMPLHVRESHYVLTDVPLTFFVTLALLLSLRAYARPRPASFAWAGAAAGFAAATKYPGAVAMVMPLVAAFIAGGERPPRRVSITAVIGGAAGAFLVGAPYTLLDLPGFLNGFGRLAALYAPATGQPVWLTYLKHLRNALWWPAVFAAIAGLAVAVLHIIKGPRRMLPLVVVLFAVLFFTLLARQSGLVFGRYLLPLTPMVCLLVAAAAEAAGSAIRRSEIGWRAGTALAAAGAVAILSVPTVTAASFDAGLFKTTTSALTYDWLLRNVPASELVVVECADLVVSFAPFRSAMVPQLRMKTEAQYSAMGAAYLVGSSACYGRFLEPAEGAGGTESAEYQQLFSAMEEVARFTPSANHPGPEYRILKVR